MEGFHNRGHRVRKDDPLEALRDGRNRVHHGRSIHEELHAELHPKAQVLVFGGE